MTFSLKVQVNFHSLRTACKSGTLWQFFKFIISSTYLISCQQSEKRNIDNHKVIKCIDVGQKLKELNAFLDEYVGDLW